MSTDPALSDYIPGAPINDEVKKQNQNLPGMGGVFNYVNMHLYHYAGNNPVKYVDPDGKIVESPWDAISLGIGIASLIGNIKKGDVKGIIVDSIGVVADAAAFLLPGVPGGAGAAIKTIRAADKIVDALKTADTVATVASGAYDTAQSIKKGDVAGAVLNGASTVTPFIGKLGDEALENAGDARRAIRNEVPGLPRSLSDNLCK